MLRNSLHHVHHVHHACMNTPCCPARRYTERLVIDKGVTLEPEGQVGGWGWLACWCAMDASDVESACLLACCKDSHELGSTYEQAALPGCLYTPWVGVSVSTAPVLCPVHSHLAACSCSPQREGLDEGLAAHAAACISHVQHWRADRSWPLAPAG